jgi:hypothetical protein
MALQTATNPTTGERVALVGDQWQPITQSATNKQGVKAYLVGGNWLTDDATTATPAPSTGVPGPRAGPSAYGAAPSNPVLKALYSPVVGAYRGLQDITDTLVLGGAKALDYISPKDQTLSGLVTGQRPSRAAEIEKTIAQQKAQFEQQYGGLAGAEVGRVGGQIVGTLPVGGVIAAPIKKAAQMAPSLAKFLTPLATTIESAGFQTGLKPGVANVATKGVGGAVVGGASAAAVNPEDTEMGAAIGAVVPTVVAPLIGKAVNYGRKIADLKSATYLDAVEGKGRDIINALRDKGAIIVPGSAPTAGQVAAPVGGAKFSALQQELSELPGVATEYAGAAAQTNQARLAQEMRAQQRFQNVAGKLQAKIDRNLVDVSPSEIGDALSAAANAERQSVKANVTEPAYKAAFNAAGDAKIDISNVIADAERILDRKLSSFATETAPDTVRKLRGFMPAVPEAEAVSIGKAGFKTAKTPTPPPATPEATLLQLDDVRKAINADIAAASASNAPMAATTLRNLRQLHTAIDDAIGKSTTLADDAKTLYADAVSKYRTEYAPRFKEGVNANLFKRTSLGEDKIRPEDVINRYFTPNGESEARQFTQLFGNNPDALKIARAGIEDVYRKKVAQGGMSHANFMRDYGRTIDIYDGAGMNLRQRFDVIDKDAQRLARVEDMAKASGNKLAPALPPGSNALAVEARIGELTKGLDNRQLTAINSVRDDLAREAEFERLASAGRKSGKDVSQIATQVGKESGVAPTSAFLSMPITIYNAVVKRLLGVVDDKLAMELAREMLSPAVTAESIQKAMARQAEQQVTNQLAKQIAPRAAAAAAQMPASENQNALAR